MDNDEVVRKNQVEMEGGTSPDGPQDVSSVHVHPSEDTIFGSHPSHLLKSTTIEGASQEVDMNEETMDSFEVGSENPVEPDPQEVSAGGEADDTRGKEELDESVRQDEVTDHLEQDRNGEIERTGDDPRRDKEDTKEPRLNGEYGSRNSTGKRGRSRNSGSGSGAGDQSAAWTSPFFSSSSSSSYKNSVSSSGGSKHKQTRRRNYHHHHQGGRARRQNASQLVSVCREFLTESVSPWCISCIHMVVELIVSVAHRCGVVVESGGISLFNLGSYLLFRITDLPGLKKDVRRVLDWTWFSGVALLAWTNRSTSWAKRAVVSCFGLLHGLLLLGTHWTKCTLRRLGGERGQRWWAALQNCWAWKKVAAFKESICGWFQKRGSRTSSESSGVATGKYQPGQELERLLALAQVPEEELDPFAVLGVDPQATEFELKRAYRQLAVQVHPDKNKHPRAGEAFKVLRAAWDIVSNPETRREYELKRMAATELSRSMNEFLTKLQDDLKEAMNTMMCTKCEGKHKRFEMDREPSEARFCAECNKRHGAEEGDLWAESSMLGLRITYFAFMDGKVYDITEWAGCQRISISPDTHRVPYHISFGSKSNSGPSRHRGPPEHPPGTGSPADLQDFFNRIFQGGHPSDVTANGGFFPPGASPHHPPGAGPGAGGPFPGGPSPQTGFFGPGGHRGDPAEHWTGTDGAKPPRRKKKARKPFQR
ncbi:dnaJ homolog subfamily C member 14 [Chanos chanos]|uniref:DnaJ homolog subfamily C member 14 n=1 Tax=Chanos chanos TaxID=29144 RepID=A0A6J2VQR4_CHACN|nr:dnaJ homolog subfamily C member 14 [Chanos chanos]